MDEHHGHVAIPGQRSSSRGEKKHLLDTLPGVDESREFIARFTLPISCPFVEGQDDVVEFEAILVHVYEPHGHATGPGHEPEELVGNKSVLLERVQLLTR